MLMRLHRHNNSGSGSGPGKEERIHFNFSHFIALQVPKGWDKLIVSLVSADTGKTVANSIKALVRNGKCQWTETLSSESIWLTQYDDDGSKELEQSLLKIVISKGSSRSGILGETIINLVDYASSEAYVPILLPLKNCNHGTTIQFELQCLTPRTNIRRSYDVEHMNEEYDDMENKSDASGSTYTKSIESLSSNLITNNLQLEETESRNTSFSASGSRNSFDSATGSIDGINFSPMNNLNWENVIEAQESFGPPRNAIHGTGFVDHLPRSNHLSFNSRFLGLGSNHKILSLRDDVSTKDLLEAAEDTIDELRAEARTWERKARKVMLDVQKMKNELENQSRNRENLDFELSASNAECDGLKKENEQLKLLIEKLRMKEMATEKTISQSEGVTCIQKELEAEMKFQRESNTDLAQQLQQTQESNLELVSILQELEETIEEQKSELNKLKVKPDDEVIGNGEMIVVEDTSNIAQRLQELQESHKELQETVKFLEETLEDKNKELELERNFRKKSLSDIEAEWKSKLSMKDEHITKLEAKLSVFRNALSSQEMRFTNVDQIGEIQSLKEKVQELEKDCNELTDENLELLFKLKESRKDIQSGGNSSDSSICELQTSTSPRTSAYEVELLRSQIYHLEEELKRKEAQVNGVTDNNLKFQLIDLQNKCSALEIQLQTFQDQAKAEMRRVLEGVSVAKSRKEPEKCSLRDNNLHLPTVEDSNLKMELVTKMSKIEELQTTLSLKEEETEALRRVQYELETQISNLRNGKNQLEERLEIVSRESCLTSKCLDEVRNDMRVLQTTLDSHISSNKILEKNALELQSGKHDLELNLSELEEENLQLSDRVCGLEAQLRYFTNEKESSRLELESSKSLAKDLRTEIRRLEAEKEMQRVELKQRIQDMQKKWLEAQEECEYLKKANPKLQTMTESLIEECSINQTLNRELRKGNLELHECRTKLEAELRESRKIYSECLEKVQLLEVMYCSMQEDVTSKENFLKSELDALFNENKEKEEKLILEKSLLNQRFLEKEVEVENLQREVVSLTEQIGSSSTHDERDRVASGAALEVSCLRVDKAKLESALREAQVKSISSETELRNLQLDSQTKVQELISELSTSKNNHELLIADREKLRSLLNKVKCSEEILRTTVNGLELKLSVSEYERQQQVEEFACLKVQLQKIGYLQDEISFLKSSLNQIKFEKTKVETSLQSLSEDFEEMKGERNSFAEKISSMQNSLSDLDDCRLSKVALEEKLLRLEGDLTAKDALCAQDTELKHELNKIKRANSQLQRKVQSIEEEKNEFLKRARDLEEELKSKKQYKQRGSSSSSSLGFDSDTEVNIHQDESNFSEEQGGNKYRDHNEMPNVLGGVDLVSKIQLLENELTEALEANELYKGTHMQMSKESQNGHARAPMRSISEGMTIRNTSLLEAELKDLRERYFHMSLRFVEVEAEREELVMKLKLVKTEKRWFS